MKIKNIIVGAGLSGIVLANKIANELDEEVLLIEKRDHIGGNCYDYYDENGFLIHKYGPHVFHTNDKKVWEYLNKFSDFTDYQHEAGAFIDSNFINLPFNLNSLYSSFSFNLANKIEKSLLSAYKYGDNLSIVDLQQKAKADNNAELLFISEYILEKVFKNYSYKQWGISIDKIDKSVLSRVSIRLSNDNRYFQDKYQGMPVKGYTNMFNNMLTSNNIRILLNTDFNKIKEDIKYENVFYSASIDEFYDYKYGKLEYRKTKFILEEYNINSFQNKSVINYPNEYNYTRITEFKKLYPKRKYIENKTIILKEYPGIGNILCYPINDKNNIDLYIKYLSLKDNNIYFIGRLGKYKYLDMGIAVREILDLFNKIKNDYKRFK